MLQKSELGQERPSSWRIAKHGSEKAILKEVLTEPVADVKGRPRTLRSHLRLRKSKKDASEPKAKVGCMHMFHTACLCSAGQLLDSSHFVCRR